MLNKAKQNKAVFQLVAVSSNYVGTAWTLIRMDGFFGFEQQGNNVDQVHNNYYYILLDI